MATGNFTGGNNSNLSDYDRLVDRGHSSMVWTEFICYQLLGFPISIIGITGNVMNIWVWTAKKMHWGKSSTSCYLVALSCSDLLYLMCINFGRLLPSWSIIDGENLVPIFPQTSVIIKLKEVIEPLIDLLANTSIYLVVAFTAERFIAVTYPMKGRIICTPRRASLIILTLIVVILLLHIPIFLEHNPTLQMMGFHESTGYKFGYNWGIMVLLFAVAPLIMLSFFNSMLIKTVMKSRRHRAQMLQKAASATVGRDNNFVVLTLTIVLVVFIFFLCHTPAAVILCVFTYREHNGHMDALDRHRWYKTFAIANFLSMFNSSLNFLLYSIFSAKFRSTVYQLLCKKICKIISKGSQAERTHNTKGNSGETEYSLIGTKNGKALVRNDHVTIKEGKSHSAVDI